MESIFSIIEALAHACGFPLVRATSAMLNPQAFSRYDEWITAGKMGEMTYMARDPLRRQSVKALLPEAKSVICLAMPYGGGEEGEYEMRGGKCGMRTLSMLWSECGGKMQGRPFVRHARRTNGLIAKYAYGRDYHKIIEKMLKNLTRALVEKFPGEVFKSYVDTGAVLERAYAAEAGIGFIGKNTMLITKEFGSWVFLAEILTTLEIPRESNVEQNKNRGGEARDKNGSRGKCGYCRLCHDICPTGALSEKGLDARRCISYLTIEYRGSIPVELRPLMGNRLFGCDACQEICPQNTHGATHQARSEAKCPLPAFSLTQRSALPCISFRGERNVLEGRLNTGQLLNIHPAVAENGIPLVKNSESPFVSPCDTAVLLADILNLRTKEEFNQRFQGSAVRRAKREGLVRNACVVAANIKAKSLLPLLKKAAKEDASEIVREHARWATGELSG